MEYASLSSLGFQFCLPPSLSPEPNHGQLCTRPLHKVGSGHDCFYHDFDSHSIRSSQSGTRFPFRQVKSGDVRVTLNRNGSLQETRKVARIERVSPPGRNKDKNVLEASLKLKETSMEREIRYR